MSRCKSRQLESAEQSGSSLPWIIAVLAAGAAVVLGVAWYRNRHREGALRVRRASQLPVQVAPSAAVEAEEAEPLSPVDEGVAVALGTKKAKIKGSGWKAKLTRALLNNPLAPPSPVESAQRAPSMIKYMV